jgi:hypothetical protein
VAVSDQKKFRLTIWDFSISGWRGTQKAVVYDASDIGVEENANDVGSAFWTMKNDHPQISEFVPLERHYEIARWNDSIATPRWEFVGAGVINDFNATEYETVFAGIDYKAVMNQVTTPLSQITFANASPINPNLATVQKTTIFNSTDGVVARDQVYGSSYDVNGLVEYDVTESIQVSTANVVAYANTTKTVSVVSGATTYTASVQTPYVQLTYQIDYTGATTLTGGFTGSIGGLSWTGGFSSTPLMRVAIFASPPAALDLGDPPIGSTGRIAEFSIGADGSSGVNRFKATNRLVDILPFSARQELYDSLVSQGAASATVASALIETPTGSANKSGTQTVYAFRNGLTYSLDLYAGIYAAYSTANNRFFVSTGSRAKSSVEVTLGQGTNSVVDIVQRVFNNVATGTTSGRLRYSTMSVINSGSTATTHTVYSAGEPSLQHIGDVCDIEMGARTDGGKVVFGIAKPSAGSSYDGNFQLRLNVSSSPITTGPALRYPETIKSYTYAPGYAKVRNDVTIIPTEKYLSGATGQGTGASIIGATASNSSSIAQFGRIPMVVAKGGFVNSQSATNEASRMIELYGTLRTNTNTSILNSTVVPKNTKQVGLRIAVDGLYVNSSWDVGDSINVQIKHGLVDINEPFVIAGYRWYGESDGHERLEMDLVQGSSFAASYNLSAATPSGDQMGAPSAPSTSSFGGTAVPRSRKPSPTSRTPTTTTTTTTTTTSLPGGQGRLTYRSGNRRNV